MVILSVCNIHAQWSQSLIYVVWDFSFHIACGNMSLVTVMFMLHRGLFVSHLQRGNGPA